MVLFGFRLLLLLFCATTVSREGLYTAADGGGRTQRCATLAVQRAKIVLGMP